MRSAGFLHTCALSAALATMMAGEVEVPAWVIRGIASVESSSRYDGGKLVYVDRRMGSAGELGPFQMKRIAWREITRGTEQFNSMATDVAYAETCAKRYLLWLYTNTADKSWVLAVQQYHAGPGKRSRSYLNRVMRAGKP